MRTVRTPFSKRAVMPVSSAFSGSCTEPFHHGSEVNCHLPVSISPGPVDFSRSAKLVARNPAACRFMTCSPTASKLMHDSQPNRQRRHLQTGATVVASAKRAGLA